MTSTSLPRVSLLSPAAPFRQSLAGKIVGAFAASMFVAICAHISVPMPFTPVPTTMQTFAVILVGMTLGPIEACAALALYLAEGATGLPVFSPHGLGGVAQLVGPTGGYLFAYPLAAGIAGASVRALRGRIGAFPAAWASGLLALVPVFSMGALWLAHSLHLDGSRAILLAVAPFLLPEVVKLTAAAAAYSALDRGRPAAR